MENNPSRGLFGVSSPQPEEQRLSPQPTAPIENIYYEIPVYPQEHFAYHKRPFWPALFLKRIGLTCYTFVSIIVTCSLQIILLSNYSATYNFSTCS